MGHVKVDTAHKAGEAHLGFNDEEGDAGDDEEDDGVGVGVGVMSMATA